MTLHEVAEASSLVQRTADPEANIIFGTVIDKGMTDEIKITVIATGFNREPKIAAEVQVAAAAQRGFAQRPMTADAPPGRPARDLDSPTFLPRSPMPPASPQHSSASVSATPMATARSSDPQGQVSYASLQDELDVPTFLRKQMD